MNPARTSLQARLMITFARIVDAGSISATATQMGQDKAAVSRQLSELEDMLQVRLLNRSTRQLSLTEVGQVVYARANRVLEEVENAQREAEVFQASPSGALSVSASVAFGRTQVVPHLRRFLEKFPDISLNLCLLDRQVDLIDEGFDVLLRLCEQPPEQLVAYRLASITYKVVASPGLLQTLPPICTPEDLSQHHCLFYGYRVRKETWRFNREGRQTDVEVNTRVSINSSDALRDLALNGFGIALLPNFAIAGDVADGRLEVLLPDWEPAGHLGTSLYALHLPGRHLAPKVRSFIQFLRDEWVPSLPWANAP